MRTKTVNSGADDERVVWMAKCRRLLKKVNEQGVSGACVLNELIEFGKGRVKRNLKAGGLGKK